MQYMTRAAKIEHNYGHRLHHVTEISQFLKVPGFMEQAAECEYTI